MTDDKTMGRTTNQTIRADARLRGKIASAAHRGDPTPARGNLAHPSPSVRSTALAALVRSGAATPEDVRRAASDEEAVVRRRACELAPRIEGVDLASLLDDIDATVVEAAAFACGETGASWAVDRLAAIARSHSDALCRESAVAALGAIGDESGLAAVLDALSDRPAIRRRAVLALAPFEGEVVDAALRHALEDRDWQVRQAAEDLLGRPG